MKRLRKNQNALEEQAMLIASEIFNLINQYTHDSGISKFFLTDEIARACYGLSGGFSAIIYSPALKPRTLKDSAILSYVYALMTYGFNMYLKERSLRTNAAPYSLPRDKKLIKQIQKKTLAMISEGELTSTPLADKIIDILVRNVKNQMDMQEFMIKGHKLQKRKFLDYTKLSLYWGYNFARSLLPDDMQLSAAKK